MPISRTRSVRPSTRTSTVSPSTTWVITALVATAVLVVGLPGGARTLVAAEGARPASVGGRQATTKSALAATANHRRCR